MTLKGVKEQERESARERERVMESITMEMVKCEISEKKTQKGTFEGVKETLFECTKTETRNREIALMRQNTRNIVKVNK